MSDLTVTLSMASVGAIGALMGEFAEVVTYVRREKRLPWVATGAWHGRIIKGQLYPSMRTYALTVSFKMLVAFALVAVEVWGKQISGPIGAFTIGAAATPIMTRLASEAPVGSLLNQENKETGLG